MNYQLKQLCRANRDGSFSTQADRSRHLTLAANQLVQLGFRGMGVTSLKPKHIDALVQRWVAEGRGPGTIKNRMVSLRWWASKIGKPGLIHRDNDAYGIAHRTYVADESKARSITESDLMKVKDQYVRMSLVLQREFGLRREEAIKFRPSFADRNDRIVLKASWTKGGREREIPVRTESQRQALAEAHRFVGNASLIPSHLSYIQQVKVYSRHTVAAGLSCMHGLRHLYAQNRYYELTGWRAPFAGGPKRRELNGEQRERDVEARQVVSRELGHERIQITEIYLGK